MTASHERGTPVGRRIVLGMSVAGVAGVLGGARAQDLLERWFGPVTARDPTGIAALFPLGRFRIYSVTGSLPRRSKVDYRLRVDGLVDRPFTLTFDELLALPATGITRDFQCVTGWRVRDVDWKGVALSRLLDRAGVHAGAAGVTFHSFDGLYTESLSLRQARRPDVLVAYELEGRSISRNHGGPARLYVAPMYGYKSCKWLERIEVTAAVEPGYWEQRGYDQDAWVGRSNGRDDDPT